MLTNANGLGGTPSWSQIAASSTLFPEHRSQHSAVYDPTSNQMTIFGGHIALTSPISLSNDVWVLGNANGLVGAAPAVHASGTRVVPTRPRPPGH